MNPPTDAEPLELVCPICEGEEPQVDPRTGKTAPPCPHCDRGTIYIRGCPYDELSDDVFEAVKLAQLWRKGTLPEAGGYYDQTDVICDAVDLIWTEQARWRSHHKLVDIDE